MMELNKEIQLENLRRAARSSRGTRAQSLVRDRSTSGERARTRTKSESSEGTKNRSRSGASKDREPAEKKINLLGCASSQEARDKSKSPTRGWDLKKFVSARNRPESDSDEDEGATAQHPQDQKLDVLEHHFKSLSVGDNNRDNNELPRGETPELQARSALEDIPEVSDMRGYAAEQGFQPREASPFQETIYEETVDEADDFVDYTDESTMLDQVEGAIDFTQVLFDEKVELSLQVEKLTRDINTIKNDLQGQILERENELDRLNIESQKLKDALEAAQERLNTAQALLEVEKREAEEMDRRHTEEKGELREALDQRNRDVEVMKDSIRHLRQELASAEGKRLEETGELEALLRKSRSKAEEKEKEAETWRKIAHDRQKELRDYKASTGRAISKLARTHDNIKRSESRLSVTSERRVLPLDGEESGEDDEGNNEVERDGLQWDDLAERDLRRPDTPRRAQRSNWSDMIRANQLTKSIKWPQKKMSFDLDHFCELIQATANRHVAKGIPSEAVAESLHNHLSILEGISDKYNNEMDFDADITLEAVTEALKACDKSHTRKNNIQKFDEIVKGHEEDFHSLTKRVMKKYDAYRLGEPNHDPHQRIKAVRDKVIKAGKVPIHVAKQLMTCYDLSLLPIIIEDALEKINADKKEREEQIERSKDEKDSRNQMPKPSPPGFQQRNLPNQQRFTPNQPKFPANQQRYTSEQHRPPPRQEGNQAQSQERNAGPPRDGHVVATVRSHNDDVRAPAEQLSNDGRPFCYNCRQYSHFSNRCSNPPYCSICRESGRHRNSEHDKAMKDRELRDRTHANTQH